MQRIKYITITYEEYNKDEIEKVLLFLQSKAIDYVQEWRGAEKTIYLEITYDENDSEIEEVFSFLQSLSIDYEENEEKVYFDKEDDYSLPPEEQEREI